MCGYISIQGENDMREPTCTDCGGPAELEYEDDGKSVAYAHCMEQCWECCLCYSLGNIGYGHNARPLEDGRCCDDCNHKVIAYRILTGLLPYNYDE